MANPLKRKHIIVIGNNPFSTHAKCELIISKNFLKTKTFRLFKLSKTDRLQFSHVSVDAQCIWVMNTTLDDLRFAYNLLDSTRIEFADGHSFEKSVSFVFKMHSSIELNDLPVEWRDEAKFEIHDLNAHHQDRKKDGTKNLIQTKSIEQTIQSILDMPPYQLPPVVKTKSGKYVIDLTIGQLEICLSCESWQAVITHFKIALAAAQPMPAFKYLMEENLQPTHP